MALKSAWEIALEKNERYERLSPLVEELLEHVAMLEECWDAIAVPDRAPAAAEPLELPRAA